jgi:succinate dehydrogenase hydrophobic anchor subunit
MLLLDALCIVFSITAFILCCIFNLTAHFWVVFIFINLFQIFILLFLLHVLYHPYAGVQDQLINNYNYKYVRTVKLLEYVGIFRLLGAYNRSMCVEQYFSEL